MHLHKETDLTSAGQKRRRPENNEPFPDIEYEEMYMDFRVRRGEIQEDQLTALMEHYSARWPSSLFMGAAIASMAASLLFKCQRKDHHALFIGQWAAPFLILGLYNKIVKQHGSDASRPDGPEQNGPRHDDH